MRKILALEEAGEQARGATLVYQSGALLPPGPHGALRGALIAAGVARVVVAMEDPNPLVAGDGLRQLRAAGIQAEIAAGFRRRSRETE